MKSTIWFALLLAVLLIGFCWAGNSLRGDPHTVSMFPFAVTLLAFPLAIIPGLLSRARTGQRAVAELRRAGWAIVWPAATLFACFTTLFAAALFTRPAAIFLAYLFACSLVLTAALGMLCVQLCAVIIASNASQSRAA